MVRMPASFVRRAYIFLCIVTVLHFILSISFPSYGRVTSESISRLAGDKWFDPFEGSYVATDYDCSAPARLEPSRKANATILFLARNSDLQGVVTSLKQMEDRFNKRFRYPYTFLNDKPFSDKFKQTIVDLTDAPVEFGLIPPEDWNQPGWIDENKAAANRKEMQEKEIVYAAYRASSRLLVPIMARDIFSYRNMCRFNSGFFYRHSLMQKYRYYWRVEPDVIFYCDLGYDPFLYMQDNEKVYGFNIVLPDYIETIASLWNVTKQFIAEYPEVAARNNSMDFISDDGGETYNLCHFWSNFEIADADFWRSEAYSKYFTTLDAYGGFYYERWGDAPVHSIAASLFLPRDKLHFFNDIGYRHHPLEHCPIGELHKQGKCWCKEEENFDYHWYSCMPKFERMLQS
ncbi:glycosyltransferase family 15 protein [Vararia minispora EC-137]|uniref:Glycosyltransferase family 15 protein n=1 Tax=Vararia minispora EC-137 TaxID=1314806 RepID=A0ACB8QTR2_9AGAM|nr:glycosyltransferase family 15 protein [Vararia minispora EC-137]